MEKNYVPQNSMPEVIVNSPQPPSHPPNRKIWMVIVFFVILIPLSLLIYLNRSRIISKFNKPNLVLPKTSSIKSIEAIRGHPAFFYADLDINPQNNLVTLLKTGTGNGDFPDLMKIPPATSSAKLIYKVELLSEQNELLQSGWQYQYKKLILTKKNTYQLRLTSYFRPKAIIKLYVPSNQL